LLTHSISNLIMEKTDEEGIKIKTTTYYKQRRRTKR
jgi:hypothetical protein